jgi:transcriptional regulator with XRE-family HTH domain
MRSERGYTQRELAKALNTSREVVAKWENGSRTIGIEHLVSLAEIFQLSCDEILRNKKPENITFSEKTGLSDESIESLATDFKPNRVLVAAINYLIESDYLKHFCTDVINSVSLDLNYQRTIKEKAEKYNELDEMALSAMSKEVRGIFTVFCDLEDAGIYDLKRSRQYYLEREAYTLTNELYDFLLKAYKDCNIVMETSDNDE